MSLGPENNIAWNYTIQPDLLAQILFLQKAAILFSFPAKF